MERHRVRPGHRMLAIVLAFAWLPAASARCIHPAAMLAGCCLHEGPGAGTTHPSPVAPHRVSRQVHACCAAQLSCGGAPAVEPHCPDGSVTQTLTTLPAAAF